MFSEHCFDNTEASASNESVRRREVRGRVYAGDFLQLYNDTEENIMFRRIMQLAKKQRPPKRRTQPKPEEDLGGGDIRSLQEQPSTDDDQPLD